MCFLREGRCLGLENGNVRDQKVTVVLIREKNVRDSASFIRVIYMIGK